MVEYSFVSISPFLLSNTFEFFWKMEQWNENENIISIENETCQIFLNDVLMEEVFENYLSLEIESNIVYQNEKEKMKKSL